MMMREVLAGFVLCVLFIAMISPESVGAWLKRVDDVRFVETMYE